MSFTYWPLTTETDVQRAAVWAELVSAINERAAVVGVSALDVPVVGTVWFQRSAFRSIIDKINELLPYYLDDSTLVGNFDEFEYNEPAVFSIEADWVVQKLAHINELYEAVLLMNRTIIGNGIQSGTATSVDGDLAQQASMGEWMLRYDTPEEAMTALWSCWNAFREVYKETNRTWSMGTIFSAAKNFVLNKYHGLFDADWCNVTSDGALPVAYTIPNENAVLYAKLSKSFWAILPWSSDWKPSYKFTDYPFYHPGGFEEGRWGALANATSWNGLYPVTNELYNECLVQPEPQNWNLMTHQFYVDTTGTAQYDAMWVVKWPWIYG